MPAKQRLDLLLVARALAPSREKAQALIMAGQVLVNQQCIDKPGRAVPHDAAVLVQGHDHPYVSRGGLKLAGALRDFAVDPTERVALDIGASTGGFTDCLLQHDARKVYAVDVGYGQLAWSLQQDPRVVSLERTNIRYVTSEAFNEPISLMVVDASFISLRLILPKTWELLESQGDLLALVKPQFEAGRQEVGRGGKVRDERVHERILDEVSAAAQQQGFHVCGRTVSDVAGKKSGNTEFFLHLYKPGSP
jgi:23S rRNA (cytidine1920-2'-O)/16S rRNA (cytidine1409-2'-O)-methyltransferase